MKILKGLLLLILGVIVFALVVALFVKKDYVIEREIVINKPRDSVYNYLKYLKNQDNFSKWANMDPAMKKGYRGTDGTVGFVAMWESEKREVGKGEQEIIKLEEGARIDLALRFKKPYESNMSSFLSTTDYQGIATLVKWNINGKMDYPMNLMMLFMNMDKVLGADLQTGLDNLKTILESKK
jgi:hypothetical protein